MKRLALGALLLGVPSVAQAQLPTGTWVQRSTPGNGSRLVMTVEALGGGGRRLTYRLLLPDGTTSKDMVLTADTQFDGKDAPVLSKGAPTGETMAVRLIDSNHFFTILKVQGQEFGTSKAELSADGKVLKIENDMGAARGTNTAGKTVEYWDRK